VYFSTREMLLDIALYKLTIDIDIDILISSTFGSGRNPASFANPDRISFGQSSGHILDFGHICKMSLNCSAF